MRSRSVCARRRGSARRGTSAPPLFLQFTPPALAGPLPAGAAGGTDAGVGIGMDAGPPLEMLNGVERAVHVGVVTVSNLVNGAVVGALFGLVTGAWSKRSLSGAVAEARANGASWGAISAMYAGLQTASRVIRNRDDRLNSVVGACGSGAAFTAKGGPRAALQGCVSFAALSYLIDVVTTPKEAENAAEDPLSPEVILRKK